MAGPIERGDREQALVRALEVEEDPGGRARDQEAVSRRFSGKSDDFDGLDCEIWQTDCPMIQGCVATLGCEPYAAYDGGDHLIILGRVAYLDCQPEMGPLLFYQGSYGSFT